MAVFTGAIVFAALALAGYAAPPLDNADASLIATLVIMPAGLLHALKLCPGAWQQNAAVEVLAALVTILSGLPLYVVLHRIYD